MTIALPHKLLQEMTTDIAGLCERLRAVRSQGIRSGKLWNEDGPEAANTIERHVAEIERLRGALSEAAEWHQSRDKALSKQPPSGARDWQRMEHQEERDRIRAALTGEDHEAGEGK